MAADIEAGAGLAESFKKHPSVFSYLYCSMIEAGEKSGSLVEVLDRLVYIIEHENRVKADIKAAMRYPTFVVLFLCVAFVVLLTVVIPKFISVFTKAGLDLPLPTRICMGLYQFVAHHWVLIVLAAVGIVAALTAYVKTPGGRHVRDALMLRLPLIGKVFQKAAMSRFGSIFSILQSSGVSVLESMDILSGTIGNAAISRQLGRVRDMMAEGRGISDPLKSSRYFSPMVIHMVAVGEETGNLDELLKEMSVHYDAEVEFAMKKLSDSIGPVLTIALAAVVGFFALAIFLPMWDLTKLVK
jgi:type IV pilus assembly protein PilC